MDSKTITVSEIIKEVENGELVIPDFQRSFIWEPEDVRQLLISVIGGYFIGSILVLETIYDEAPFALRLVEGVSEVNKKAQMGSLIRILLDGQQRVTSLFYALHKLSFPLKDRKSPTRFFVNVETVDEEDWEDMVVAVGENEKAKLKRVEENPNFIPVPDLRLPPFELFEKYKNYPYAKKIGEVAKALNEYRIHTVVLKDKNLDRIVETFERINKGGRPLSIFDLLVARLYKDGVKLRDLYESSFDKYEFIKEVSSEAIIKVIALFREKVPARKNILEIDSKDFANDWNRACDALEKAYKRFKDIKDGYGVIDYRKWAPYSPMIVPLAAMLKYLEESKLKNPDAYEKINHWYWHAVFTNRYDQAVDTQSYHDYKSVREWIANDSVPAFMQGFNLSQIDLDVDKQRAATYRGVISLVVLKGAYDFKTGLPPTFEIDKLQDDHIFPKSVFKTDNVLNRTLISTNQSKIDKKPSIYFKERIRELGNGNEAVGREKMKEILKSHLIPEEAFDALLSDNLQEFLELRRKAVMEEIGKRLKLLIS